MKRDDEALLHDLAEALAPERTQPSPDRVAALRRQAEAHKEPAQVEHRRRSPALVGMAIALVVVLAFGAGAIVSDRLPRPVREVAHGIGLPVHSPEYVDAQEELDHLAEALAVDDLEAARAADEAMLDAVADLDEDERAELLPVAHEVHQRYLEHLSEQFEP